MTLTSKLNELLALDDLEMWDTFSDDLNSLKIVRALVRVALAAEAVTADPESDFNCDELYKDWKVEADARAEKAERERDNACPIRALKSHTK